MTTITGIFLWTLLLRTANAQSADIHPDIWPNYTVDGGRLTDHSQTDDADIVIQPSQITALLNSLLTGYNKHLRPGIGGHPLEVSLNILIRSMGPISEENMMFSMDCYFRQYWHDARLQYQPPHAKITELRPSIKMLNEIWKPDTFILNGQRSHLHTITTQNKLFRIKSNGDVLYSQRLTIKSNCPMTLRKYPLDVQHCPLYISSFAYGSSDLELRWRDVRKPIAQYANITMSQFLLAGIEHGNNTAGLEHGDRDSLTVVFQLKREIGYYLLQIYLPCYLTVIISWVSFWINREATPARVTLGITTLLTTSTIALTGREGIPKVSYSTALDVYLLMCFWFVFAALVEYAGVNYFTKTPGTGIHKFATDCSSPPEENARPPHMLSTSNGHSFEQKHSYSIPPTVVRYGLCQSESCCFMFLQCLKGNAEYRHHKSQTRHASLSVSKIDTVSRLLFPASFIVLNICYWAVCLYSH